MRKTLAGNPARTRNPDWSEDETILLVDLYQRAPQASARHPEVLALSALLNEVARAQGLILHKTFRNPVGIAMKLRNLAQQDPAARAQGRTGLRPGGMMDTAVWERYAHDPVSLRSAVNRVFREWRVAGAASSIPTTKSSRGPAPSFGAYSGERSDAEATVYLLLLDGAVEAIFPQRSLAAGWGVVKIGRSSDTERRIGELSAGFPPGSALAWRRLREYRHPGSLSAHRSERALLHHADVEGWSIGGEFVIAPLDLLMAAADAIADPEGPSGG